MNQKREAQSLPENVKPMGKMSVAKQASPGMLTWKSLQRQPVAHLRSARAFPGYLGAIALPILIVAAAVYFLNASVFWVIACPILLCLTAILSIYWNHFTGLVSAAIATISLLTAEILAAPNFSIPLLQQIYLVLLLICGCLLSLLIPSRYIAKQEDPVLQEQNEAREQSLNAANRQIEDFLTITSRELKANSTRLQEDLEITRGHLTTLLKHGKLTPAEQASKVIAIQRLLDQADEKLERQQRLVGDVIKAAHTQVAKREVHLPTPMRAAGKRAVTIQLPLEEEQGTQPAGTDSKKTGS